MKKLVSNCMLILLISLPVRAETDTGTPSRFVDIKDIEASILVEMRYYGKHNFTGRPVKGYQANKCLMLKDVANGLAKVQHDLLKQNKSLKVYDCYRPQQAVTEFMRWAKDTQDTLMKTEFYPNEKKATLIAKGYIASRSGHSRGDSLDLTIVNLPIKEQAKFDIKKQADCTATLQQRYQDNSLDMGTGYDCFDSLSHTQNPKTGPAQLKNRLLLKKIMEKYGFRNYSKEWWHYSCRNPAGKKEFYDFVIK